jgi:hypothetical protein
VGIHRAEHPGVVIGLGEGWWWMKKTIPRNIYISTSSPHLDLLTATLGGPIAQVIRGNHRSQAIKRYSNRKICPGENFWYYEVLVPGISYILYFLFGLLKFFYFFILSYQYPST